MIGDGTLVQQTTSTNKHHMAFDACFQATSGDGGKAFGRCAGRQSSCFRSLDNRRGKGMLRTLFRFSYETQQLVFLPAANRDDISQFRLAFGDGARLVAQHGAHRLNAFQALAAAAFDAVTLPTMAQPMKVSAAMTSTIGTKMPEMVSARR